MKRALLGAVLLLGCGPPPSDCVHDCGIRFVGEISEDQCQLFKNRVDSGFDSFEKNVHDDPPFVWTAARICKSVSHVTVRVHPLSDGKSWYSEQHGFPVAGITYCETQAIFVANQDWGTNALVHEMAHIYECSMGGYNTTGAHPRWNERGVYAAIGASQF